MDRIRQLLAGEIGFAADVLGSATLDRTAQERMRALDITSVESYGDRLLIDRLEVAALVEAIVVPETWFFRDSEPFRVVGRLMRGWPSGRRLRMLSVPCSTGEEPYSLVMAAADQGFELDLLDVTGVDVSVAALERAKRGVFGRNSFRGDAALLRPRHFKPSGDDWVLDDRLRRPVTLVQGNALSLSSVLRGTYDVILCRNLLIYLTGEARARVLASLMTLLAEEGTLIVGHADLIDARSLGLALHGDPAGFAYRRAPAVDAPAPRAASETPTYVPTTRTATPTAVASRQSDRIPLMPAAPPPTGREGGPVERARTLADRGDLAAACTLLLAHLDQLGPDGDAYHLLGTIESARGDRAAAEKYLARALYCDPSNQATLLQLALLSERRGDDAAAANFRRRAQRLRGGRT